ncbi:MAG TPA: signal peptidase I [Candidatus Polarisedimenticolaceae bacterium]|nr:signal peptidase I [Candidatus Polarisedimenticolaceae bacterium]
MGSRTGFTDARVSARPIPRKTVVQEYAETLLICVVAVMFLRTFIVQQSEIPSGSMEDTILVGDYILVNRFLHAPTTYDWERRWLPIREIQRGDVVVFKYPVDPQIDFIKRVLGLPGETLAVRDGYVSIDGRPLAEPYVNEQYRKLTDFGPVTIPADQYFMMGDHRDLSADSREWGPVSRELIKGDAFMILFSTYAPPDPDATAGRVTLRSLGRKVYNLVFRGRWERCLARIR